MLCVIASCLQSAQALRAFSDVNASLFLEMIGTDFHHQVVDVFTSEMGVTIRSDGRELAFFDSEQCAVESATTEVKDKNCGFWSIFLPAQCDLSWLSSPM